MMRTGQKTNDPQTMERVMSCPATQGKLGRIRAMLEGRRIRKVEFTNEAETVGIRLHLDDKQQVVVSMGELSLTMLLRDPDVAREEQDRYYQTHVYRPMRRRRRKKGTSTDERQT